MALDLNRVSSTPDENTLPTPIDIHISITGHGVDDDFNPVPVRDYFRRQYHGYRLHPQRRYAPCRFCASRRNFRFHPV